MDAQQAKRVPLYRAAILLSVLAVWEGVVAVGLARPFWVSSPSRIAVRTWELISDGTLFGHMLVTTAEALAGLAAGAVVGVAIGLLLGSSPTLAATVEPFVMALNSLPRIALAPLLILYVGIGFMAKFLIVFSLVVVIIMVNTLAGAMSVDPALNSTFTILRAKRRDRYFKLVIPSSIPWIFSGLRVSVAFAFIGAVVGEFIASQAGVGYMIQTASGAYDTTGILVPLLALMAVALAFNVAVAAVERRLLRWRPSTGTK